MRHTFCRPIPAALAASILLPIVASAQEPRPATVTPNRLTVLATPEAVLDGARRITLADAQQLAQATSDPVKRLGELQVEAARQHRLGVKSMYFPSVSTQFLSLHLSETPGEILTVQRPLTGAFISVPIAAVFQDQTSVNVVATQPITQLFAVRQLVKIARADENIARAKAGMPVTAITRQVEKSFFDLLVAQRELVAAQADARHARTRWMAVSDVGPLWATSQQADMLRADTATSRLASNVTALTATLNGLLGLPPDMRLELVPPQPLIENLTLSAALSQAQASPPLEVIEAEQTAVKAHAAAKLTKLEYVPGVAVLGGYLHQGALADTIWPKNSAYVGVVATYTLFDSFKRQRAIKEAAAQAEAADLGVELVKAKVAAAVKTAYFELERSRDAYDLARRMLSPSGAGVTLISDRSDTESRRARAEADVFRAEIAYREAYTALKDLISSH